MTKYRSSINEAKSKTNEAAYAKRKELEKRSTDQFLQQSFQSNLSSKPYRPTTSVSTPRATSSNFTTVAQREIEDSDISVVQDLPFLTDTSSDRYIKIFDSSVNAKLQDVLIINRHNTELARVNILLSTFDLDKEYGENRNRLLESNVNTVYLLHEYDLRANTTLASDEVTSNQASLRNAAHLGDVKIASKKKTIYLYAHKPTDIGTVDLTIIK
tara:strand:+ start:3551 stop:4192 length:642 start_codon:yes stop_codon:yes gene_type:complete